MRNPDRVVAALTARHPDWAILFGGYSGEFVAFPRWPGYAHRGIVTATDPGECERAMARVEAASGREREPGARSSDALRGDVRRAMP